MKGYGQFCPVAKAAEILTERWTLLVLRELLLGSRRFNDLRKGVPLMSPHCSPAPEFLEAAESSSAAGRSQGWDISDDRRAGTPPVSKPSACGPALGSKRRPPMSSTRALCGTSAAVDPNHSPLGAWLQFEVFGFLSIQARCGLVGAKEGVTSA